MLKYFRGRDNSSSDTSPQSSSSPSRSPSASPVTGPARPIRLVYSDEKGKFRMDPEAVAALQLVKGPVGVVSVCGRARQGKSYILNQVRFLFLVSFCHVKLIFLLLKILWNLGFVELGFSKWIVLLFPLLLWSENWGGFFFSRVCEFERFLESFSVCVRYNCLKNKVH